MVRGARSIIVVVLAAVAIAGCGSATTSSPLGSSLSYFPKDSPFVASIATDPNVRSVKGMQAMLRQIPFATFGEAALTSQLQKKGINYDADIRPLFGNPVVVGLAAPSLSGGTLSDFLAAWITKDAGALSTLVKKLGLHQFGSHDGATLYGRSSATVAIDGATVVIAPSSATLTAALDRHAARQGMDSSDYNRDLGSLPKNSLIEAFGNLSSVLSSPHAATARSIPWVGALRSYGVSLSAGSRGLTFQYTLNTTGASLSSAELPLSPGTSPPGLAGTMPIQFGLRQPAVPIRFLLDVARRTSPGKYATDLAKMAAVKRRTGVDFGRDVLGEIGSNAAVESMGHGATIVRIDVINPAAVARTLRKLGTSALDVLGTHPGSYVTSGPPGFETVHGHNGQRVLFGLVGSEFVAGIGASPAQLRAFAATPAVAAPGAQGAAAFRIALPELIQLAMHRPPSGTIRAVLNTLGDITGWISASPTALTGSATLAVGKGSSAY